MADPKNKDAFSDLAAGLIGADQASQFEGSGVQKPKTVRLTPPVVPVQAAPAPAQPTGPNIIDSVRQANAVADAIGLRDRRGGVSRQIRQQQQEAGQAVDAEQDAQLGLLEGQAGAQEQFAQDAGDVQELRQTNIEQADSSRATASDELRMERGALKGDRAEAQEQASRSVDYNKFWKDRNAGEKAALAFAQVLSGIGSALQGAARGQSVPNIAAQEIQRQIQSDVAEQKSRIEAGMQKLAQIGAQESSLYNDYKLRLDEIDRTERAGMEVAASELEDLSTRLGSKQAAGQARQAASQLRQRAALQDKAAADAVAARQARGSNARTKFVTKTALEDYKAKVKLANSPEMIKAANLREKRQIPGLVYDRGDGVPESSTYEKALKAKNETMGFVKEIRSFRKLASQLTAKDRSMAAAGYETELYKRVAAAAAELQEGMAKDSGGVVTDSDRTGAAKRLGSVIDGFFKPNRLARLAEIESIFSSRYKNTVTNLGFLIDGPKDDGPKSARKIK